METPAKHPSPTLPLKTGRTRTLIGIGFTSVYLAAVCALILWKWESFIGLELNTLGDFIAGAFGPLAFFWLVLGYLQQGDELKQNTDALHLQALELQNSVEQQRDLVELTRQQLNEEREKYAYELRLRNEANQPVLTLYAFFQSSKLNIVSWNVHISNAGQTCNDLRLFMPNHSSMATQVATYSTLPQGESRTFLYLTDLNYGEQVGQLAVEYFDVTGQPHRREYSVIQAKTIDQKQALGFILIKV